MAKDRSRVLYCRDAWATLQFALLAWTRDCTIAIHASPGLGDWQTGDAPLAPRFGGGSNPIFNGSLAGGKSDYELDWTEILSDFTLLASRHSLTDATEKSDLPPLTGNVITSDTPELGEWSLITLDKASAWMAGEFARVVKRMKLKGERAQIIAKRGRFRGWLHWSRSVAISESYLMLAIERLRAVCLRQNKRPRGPQAIDTRRPVPKQYYKAFRYCGRWATRFPPGRPALTASEWLRRYKARRAKQRKTNRVQKTNRKLRIPRTKHGRPSRQFERWQAPIHTVSQVEPRFEYAGDFDAENILSDFRESIA